MTDSGAVTNGARSVLSDRVCAPIRLAKNRFVAGADHLILILHYINPSTIRAIGTFRHPNMTPVVVTDSEINGGYRTPVKGGHRAS